MPQKSKTTLVSVGGRRRNSSSIESFLWQLTAALILLYFPSNTLRNITTGAIVPIATIDKFCRKSRLYSGNGTDRGDTAQYDKSAMLTVANITFWMESKEILVLAPDISTSCSDSSSISCSALSSPGLMIGVSTLVATVEATTIPLLLPLDVMDIDADRGDMNADLTPILVFLSIISASPIVISARFAAAVAESEFPSVGVGVVNVLVSPPPSLLTRCCCCCC